MYFLSYLFLLLQYSGFHDPSSVMSLLCRQKQMTWRLRTHGSRYCFFVTCFAIFLALRSCPWFQISLSVNAIFICQPAWHCRGQERNRARQCMNRVSFTHWSSGLFHELDFFLLMIFLLRWNSAGTIVWEWAQAAAAAISVDFRPPSNCSCSVSSLQRFLRANWRYSVLCDGTEQDGFRSIVVWTLWIVLVLFVPSCSALFIHVHMFFISIMFLFELVDSLVYCVSTRWVSDGAKKTTKYL